MNELETQHGENHRVSAGGKPAAKEGSVMAKFTYYINFVRKLLDEDVGELIDGNLNKLRRYDKMGVDFLCFNTSVMANPARNNKVHLDSNFTNQFAPRLLSGSEKRFSIFLGHHGPDYKIDYASDEYLEAYICSSITKEYAEAVRKPDFASCYAALLKLKESLEKVGCDPDKPWEDNDFIQVWLLENNVKVLPENKSEVENKVICCRTKTRLYHELTFLLEQMNQGTYNINERYQKIIADIRLDGILSSNDREA